MVNKEFIFGIAFYQKMQNPPHIRSILRLNLLPKLFTTRMEPELQFE